MFDVKFPYDLLTKIHYKSIRKLIGLLVKKRTLLTVVVWVDF